MHERGFPQADYYSGCADMDPGEFNCIAPSPDTFFTMKRGNTLEAAFAKAQAEWPKAKVVYASESDDEDHED